MSQNVAQTRLATALAPSGTLTVNYPTSLYGTPTTAGDYARGGAHQIVTGTNDVYTFGRHFDITFNAASFVINWFSGSPTLAAGTTLYIGLSTRGAATATLSIPTGIQQSMMTPTTDYHVRLGSPSTASANAILTATAVSGATTISTMNGALAISGVAVLDGSAGRNVTVVSSNVGDTTQTVTIRGYDFAGNKMTERLTLNGTTSVPGAKAFKTVNQLVVSATMTGNLTVGTGVILGLPCFLTGLGFVYREITNGAVATAGTITAPLTTAVSAINNADVRGTYTPNSAPNGTNQYELVVALTEEPQYLGQPQFADF